MMKLKQKERSGYFVLVNVLTVLLISLTLTLYCKFEFNALSNKISFMDKRIEYLSLHESFLHYHNKMLAVIGNRYVKKDVNPYILTNSIEVPSNSHFHVLFHVHSEPDRFMQRQHIRKYWSNQTHWNTRQAWKTIFVVTALPRKILLEKLLQESETYKDLLILNINPTSSEIRKVLLPLEWSQRLFNFDYILKTDDDFFINIDVTMQFLSQKEYPFVKFLKEQFPKEQHNKNRNQLFDVPSSKSIFLISYGTLFKLLPLVNWDSNDFESDIESFVYKTGINVKYEEKFYGIENLCPKNMSSEIRRTDCFKKFFHKS